jgi:hypothetical protein
MNSSREAVIAHQPLWADHHHHQYPSYSCVHTLARLEPNANQRRASDRNGFSRLALISIPSFLQLDRAEFGACDIHACVPTISVLGISRQPRLCVRCRDSKFFWITPMHILRCAISDPHHTRGCVLRVLLYLQHQPRPFLWSRGARCLLGETALNNISCIRSHSVGAPTGEASSQQAAYDSTAALWLMLANRRQLTFG